MAVFSTMPSVFSRLGEVSYGSGGRFGIWVIVGMGTTRTNTNNVGYRGVVGCRDISRHWYFLCSLCEYTPHSDLLNMFQVLSSRCSGTIVLPCLRMSFIPLRMLAVSCLIVALQCSVLGAQGALASIPTRTDWPTFKSSPSPKPPLPGPASRHGETAVTKALNSAIKGSNYPDVYKAGKGIIVRNPFDGFEDDTTKKVVPSTFWVNDIFSPSQLYPGSGGGNGNPWCPTSTTSCPQDPDTGDDGPFNTIQMGYVINTHMDKLFLNWDRAQSGIGLGVFYATDANSADIRCSYSAQYHGYDCPGGWMDARTGRWLPNSQKKGAGFFNGAGCHFNHYNAIDQTNAIAQGVNLVGSYTCECNYAFKPDWGKWVDHWTQYSHLAWSGGKGASWEADLAACWMNNPIDMIKLQNQLYWKRRDWNNQQVPQVTYKQNDAAANRPYWGWNEVPVDRVNVSNPSNWDAVMIKLPAAVCGGNGENDLLSCVPRPYQVLFEKQLDQWSKKGYNLNHEIVIAREYMDNNTNYLRQFFCEEWKSPNNRYTISYQNDRCTVQKHLDDILLV